MVEIGVMLGSLPVGLVQHSWHPERSIGSTGRFIINKKWQARDKWWWVTWDEWGEMSDAWWMMHQWGMMRKKKGFVETKYSDPQGPPLKPSVPCMVSMLPHFLTCHLTTPQVPARLVPYARVYFFGKGWIKKITSKTLKQQNEPIYSNDTTIQTKKKRQHQLPASAQPPQSPVQRWLVGKIGGMHLDLCTISKYNFYIAYTA